LGASAEIISGHVGLIWALSKERSTAAYIAHIYIPRKHSSKHSKSCREKESKGV
jgi:hypothetical protein